MKVRALDSTGKVKPGVFKIPVMVGEDKYAIQYSVNLRAWENVDGKLF